MKNKKQSSRALMHITVVAFWIGVWYFIAFAIKNSLLLPSPHDVAIRFFELTREISFYKTVLFSMLRVLTGTIIAVLLGIIFAAMCYLIPFLKTLIQPMIAVRRSTPVSSFIILALIWFERDELPIFIVFIMVFPIVYLNVYEGIKSTDKSLSEMLTLFEVSTIRQIKLLYIPSAMPYLRSAVMTSAGLAWKAGIAAEVLASPVISIGRMLFESKQYLEITDLFAWTFTVVLMSLIIDLILNSLSKKIFRNTSTDKEKKNA